jgi:hypothetical protein
MMAEELETSPQTEKPQPRRCPACGSRVAAMATTCLMCGASLVEEAVELEEEEEEAEARGGLPGWIRALIVVGLALVILSAGIFGYYQLMTAEPPPPEAITPTRIPPPPPPARSYFYPDSPARPPGTRGGNPDRHRHRLRCHNRRYPGPKPRDRLGFDPGGTDHTHSTRHAHARTNQHP